MLLNGGQSLLVLSGCCYFALASELKIATLVDLYNNAERGFSYPNGIDIFFKIILITRY